MIGTTANARHWGATGSDADVTAALGAALDRVQAYCRDLFEPTTGETRHLSMSNGIALATVRLRAVTSVVSGTTTLPSTAWRAIPGEGTTTADPDLLGVEVAVSGGDGLIVGAEPWNGGWSNLFDPQEPVLAVTGDWGWVTAPADVVEAVERVAGIIAAGPYVPQADDEGNPVAVPDPNALTPAHERVAPAGRVERTTGDATADRMLLPYRRSYARVT